MAGNPSRNACAGNSILTIAATLAQGALRNVKMAIYELDGVAPQLAPGAWVADSAQVIGEVYLAENASIWFGAVLRGDSDRLTVGKNSNVQDGSVLHADTGFPLCLGDNVTVGHQVMLHGCTVDDGSLIGIQSVILNGAKIGKNSIVGAGSVVTEGKQFPDNALIFGAPAKVVRIMDDESAARLKASADHYVSNSQRFARGLKRIA